MEEKIKKLAAELLEKMQVVVSEITVEKDAADYYHMNIKTPETGLLIGYHGEGIKALELILKLMLLKQEGERVRLLINVGDYREKREEALRGMAEHMVERLKEIGGVVEFPFLSPGERRVIHMHLKDNPEVEAFSEGEGEGRRLMLRFKSSEVGETGK